MCSGERPMGAAKGKQAKTMASCQNPCLYAQGGKQAITHRWILKQATGSSRGQSLMRTLQPDH